MLSFKTHTFFLTFFIFNLFSFSNSLADGPANLNALAQPFYQSGECISEATTYGGTSPHLTDIGGEILLAVLIPFYSNYGYEISNRFMFLQNIQRGVTYTDKHIISSGEKPNNCLYNEVLDTNSYNDVTNDQFILNSKTPKLYDSQWNEVLDTQGNPVISGTYQKSSPTVVPDSDKTNLDVIKLDGTILPQDQQSSEDAKSAEAWINEINQKKRVSDK